jgi:hypothetical protein
MLSRGKYCTCAELSATTHSVQKKLKTQVKEEIMERDSTLAAQSDFSELRVDK